MKVLNVINKNDLHSFICKSFLLQIKEYLLYYDIIKCINNAFIYKRSLTIQFLFKATKIIKNNNNY